jgi:hypothetical protein
VRLSLAASIVGGAFLTFVVCMSFIPDHDSRARHIDNGLVTCHAHLSRKVKQLIKDAVVLFSPPKLVFLTFSSATPTFECTPRTYAPSIIVSCRAPPA